MDQGIIMDEFDGAGKGKEEGPVDAEALARGQEEKRPESLAPGENGVTQDAKKMRIPAAQDRGQSPLDGLALGGESLLGVHASLKRKVTAFLVGGIGIFIFFVVVIVALVLDLGLIAFFVG